MIADDARRSSTRNESALRAPLIDRGLELPERVVVGRLLPAAQERGRQVSGVGGAADELDDAVARLVGALAGEAGVADERARQGVDGGDGRADRGRERRRAR